MTFELISKKIGEDVNRDNLYICLCKYFDKRISLLDYLSEEEVLEFSQVINFIRIHFTKTNKKMLNLFEKARMLYLASVSSYDYEKYLKLKNKKYLNKDEIKEFLRINLEYSAYYLCIDKLFYKIQFFLEKSLSSRNKSEVISFMENLKLDGMCKSDRKVFNMYINKFKSSYGSAVMLARKLSNILDKEEIIFSKLESVVTEIEKLEFDKLNNSEYTELSKSLDKFIDDRYLSIKLDNIEEFSKLRSRVYDLKEKLQKCQKLADDIKLKIESGRISMNNYFPAFVLGKNLSLKYDRLETAIDNPIITIDDKITLDKDGAFSISKSDGMYFLNIYVTDVLEILKQNPKLAEIAYQRGTSYYLHDKYGISLNERNIFMLPEVLSCNFLSLNCGSPRNCIVFSFIFGSDGELYSSSVDRKKVIVTNSLTFSEVSDIISSDCNLGLVQDTLRMYKELVFLAKDKLSYRLFSNIDVNKVDDLVAFSSFMVNYYVALENEFAIYRENGRYVKDCSLEKYTRSATPLRRIVSDINLAFLLNQKGIMSFNERSLNSAERNVDEIIAHLNESERVQTFLDSNMGVVKKLLKK